MEYLLPATAQAVQLVAESLHAPLGLQEGLGEGLAPSPLADEVHEVAEPALLGPELGLLDPDGFGKVDGELANFLLHAADEILDLPGSRELLPDGADDHVLSKGSPNQHAVVAGALGRAEAAVVPSGFPAHLGDRGAAGTTHHGSRQQVGREVALPASLALREPSPALPAGPAPPNLLPSGSNCLPHLLGHDPERIVILNDPLAREFGEAAALPGPRVPAALRLVPGPPAHVLLVVQDPAHRGR
ncbi:MAG: hypothetical protein WEG36_14260 [Gemmatimonadota bacterium]